MSSDNSSTNDPGAADPGGEETSSKSPINSGNFAGAFVQSLGHAVIQGPIDGVREIVNKITDKETIPKVHLVDEPVKQEFGSPAWTGQQLGKGAGTIAMLLLVGRFMRVRI
jgi:hypothetical protein